MQKRGIAVFVAAVFAGAFLTVHCVRRPAPSTAVGIGVAVVPVNNTLEIIGIVPGTPAARAGLHPGMVIEQINGTNLLGAPLSRCIAMMRGPAGSSLQLKVVDVATRATNVVDCSSANILVPADSGAAR